MKKRITVSFDLETEGEFREFDVISERKHIIAAIMSELEHWDTNNFEITEKRAT